MFRDPSFRENFRENLRNPRPGTIFQGNWERVVVAAPKKPENAGLANRTIGEIARRSGRDPLDVFLDLGLAEDLDTGFIGRFLNAVDDGVEPLVKHKAGVIALSDAGAHLVYLCDAGFGLYVLGHWVRERGAFDVALVDVRATPIECVTREGIRTRDGSEHKLDIIVFATGFDTMTGPLLRMNISGRNGLSLRQVRRAGPRTHPGLQIAGFPNLFTITGPGSPSVLCNMPVAIEQHVEWITACVAHMRAHGFTRIEATQEAMERWIGQVNDAANATLLPQARHSWYLGANVPGKPRVFMPYAGGMTRYRAICAGIARNGYEGSP